MLDPIGSFYRIRDFFISYVETSFRISDPLASEARRALLKTSGILATAPFIEPVLRYESSDKNLEDLIEEADGVLKPLSLKGRKAFVELALSGLFDGSSDDGPLLRKSQYAPYRHQVSMLERGIRPGRPGIVTSGTGSGKTESFMLPILAALSNGRRFVNEAHGYHDYVAALLEATPPGQPARSWLVCDRRFLRRYGLGYVRPAPLPIAAHLRSGYLKRGTSLDQLARSCGIDPSGLAATVAEYNRHAREGRDPEFGRGGTAFNRKQGDPAYPGPNPCVAPIERGPYYAVQVEPGCFGTFAGLKTDAQARVLDGGGQPIPGLYAAGADMASLFAGHYPSGGINLGPALTFGYIAGRHIAGAIGYEQEQAQRG